MRPGNHAPCLSPPEEKRTEDDPTSSERRHATSAAEPEATIRQSGQSVQFILINGASGRTLHRSHNERGPWRLFQDRSGLRQSDFPSGDSSASPSVRRVTHKTPAMTT